MLSDIQKQEKMTKVAKCVDLFISGNYTEEDISRLLSIPQTSVDRYLKDKVMIAEIFKKDSLYINELIAGKLSLNKKEGLSKGGVFAHNSTEYTRESNGRFNGAKSK